MRENDFFFVQISDLQFGMYRPGEDAYVETDLVRQAVACINDLRPDFVLCTGDLIDVPQSDKQLSHALEMLKELDGDIPFLAVPGNHDVGDVPEPAALAWFRERIGRDRFSFNHGGWHFLGLNSGLLADGTAAPREAAKQWTWLEEDLGSRPTEHAAGTIAFMHHPPFFRRPGEEDDYFNLPRPARDRLLDVFHRHGVHTVLAGHLHRCNEAAHGDLQVVVTGPVGMPLGDGYSGLRLVRPGPDGVRHHYFALDDRAGQRRFIGG